MTDKATHLEAAPCTWTVVGTQRPHPSTAPPSRALPRVKCAYRRSRSPSTNEGVTAWCPFLQRSFPLMTDLPLSRARPSVSQNPILLANPLQSSSSNFSWGSFLSFFAFQDGMLGTQISARGGWPTVSPPFLRLHLVKLQAVTIALEISYADSLVNSSQKTKSRFCRDDE